MNRMIQVIYKNNMLKPLNPIYDLKNNEKAWIILCPRMKKGGLEELIGTLTTEEADSMMNMIDKEFSRVEGEW